MISKVCYFVISRLPRCDSLATQLPQSCVHCMGRADQPETTEKPATGWFD